MNTNRPLAYQSTQCVLKYMDYNLRLMVARRIPSLSKTEQLIPLRIHTIELDKSTIKINDTLYKLGIIRVYPSENDPNFVKDINEEGGLDFDVDEYGFEENDDVDLDLTTSRLKMVRESLGFDPDNPQYWCQRVKLISYNKQVDELKDRIERIKLRKNREPPPFQFYIQLKIISKSGTKFERMKYVRAEKRISRYHSYLLRVLFQNKSHEIIVQHIVIKGHSYYMEEISPHIDYQGHPLKSVTISRPNGEICDTAETLKLTCSRNDRFNWTFKNSHVQIIYEYNMRIQNFQIFVDMCHEQLDRARRHFTLTCTERNGIQFYERIMQFRGAKTRKISPEGDPCPNSIAVPSTRHEDIKIRFSVEKGCGRDPAFHFHAVAESV